MKNGFNKRVLDRTTYEYSKILPLSESIPHKPYVNFEYYNASCQWQIMVFSY